MVQRQGHLDADAFTLQRLMPAFDFAVALRIVRAGLHMRHAGHTDKLLEILGDELRTIVGDDPRLGLGCFGSA